MYLGVLIAVTIGVGVGLLLVISRKPVNGKRKVTKREKLDRQVVKEKWDQIERTFSLAGPSNFKTSIMEADKLVDYVLKVKVSGENMGERLKRAKSLFRNYSDYDNLWFAHKVRNNVAHEMSHELNSAEARRAIEYFKKALKELGAL